MNSSTKIEALAQVLQPVRERIRNEQPSTAYRFDIFKGVHNSDGQITKVRSVGAAYLREGLKTYTVTLKTFLNERYYLLPNTKNENQADFVILTREAAQNINRKYFWNNVGEGQFLDGVNRGIMKLSWDVFGHDLYMNLHPINVTEQSDAARADEAA